MKPMLLTILFIGVLSMPVAIMAWLVQIFRDGHERRSRVVLSRETHAARMRFRGRLWPAFLILLGMTVLALFAIELPGNPPKRAFVDWTLVFFAGALFVVTLFIRRHYRWKRLAGPPKPKPSELRGIPKGIPAWVWVITMPVCTGLLYAAALMNWHKVRPGPVPSGWIGVGVIGIMVAVLVAASSIQLIRAHDPFLKRVYRRGLDGDVSGAIAELHREILDQGPTANRINTLVVLMITHEEYQAATEWARKGLAVEPGHDFLRSNFALALLKTGQVAEAEAIYAEMASRENAHFVYAINHADALTRLGRLDEAEHRLRVAEAKMKGTIVLGGRGTKAQCRASIAAGRAMIAQARGVKHATGLLPEL